MSTLYIDKDGNIKKWDKNLTSNINAGDPITIEYKKIRLVSPNFDHFGSSQVMVVNNIKNKQTKDNAMDTITYYDKDAKPKKIEGRKVLNIETFNPREYGNSICFFTDNYQNDIITISTRIYELDERSPLSIISKVSDLASKLPTYGAYFSIAGNVVHIASNIISNYTHRRDLCDEHIIEFRDDQVDKPLIKGLYLCIPNITDKKKIKDIINTYKLEDNALIDSQGNECLGTYFILEVNNLNRPDLLNFDFTVSNNDLLEQLNKKTPESLSTFISNAKNSDDFQIIQNVLSSIENDDINLAKSHYKTLRGDCKFWFNKHFPSLIEKLI